MESPSLPDWTTAPVPSDAWRVPSRHGRSNRVIAFGLVITLALAGIAGVAALAFGGSGDGYPDEWDPAVLDLVEYVERERGLAFNHPVTVRFLDESAFRDEISFSEDDIDPAARATAVGDAAVLRALGIADGDIDLIEVFGELNAGLTLAYYDSGRDEIVVRGTDLTAPARVSVVHELVHALQDQHFDLDRFQALDSDESDAARALVEGDATMVEDAYYATLSPTDQRAVDAAHSFDSTDVPEAVPEILTYFASSPYVFGASLVAALDAHGGRERVDDAFGDPPVSEEHLIDPLRYVLDDEPVRRVDVRLREGEEVRDRDSLGAFSLFMILAERIDAHDALAAVDGWGGGEYAAYDDATGTGCIAAVVAGDDQSEEDELLRALQEWADAGVPGAASASQGPRGISIRACDPGTDVELVTGRSSEAFALLAVRSDFFRWYVDGGEDIEVAWCVASRIIDLSTLEQLNDPDG
ncbi:MAG TPA: hypothetical protein VFZ83_01755, partial [Acidimicrobiia bacterium]|nr:hypothetical protein [Acidimicrobiia bacterium]